MIGIAITTPVIIGLWMDEFEVGLALCFGAFWCSPSDVSGSYRHKKIGILFSAGLIVIVSLIGGYLDYESWISLAILGVLSFAIAFISVYGFRASLISFSGLFALILSFANDREVLEIWQYSLLVGLGGLWYLLLTIVWHRLSRKAQTEEILAETYLLTADFLETRSLLVDPAGKRKGLQSKLHDIQIKLIEHHATLREILILSRQKSGKSNYEGRRLLIFTQLIEMLETATANPVNYDKMDALFKENQVKKTYWAIVRNRPPAGSGKLTHWLLRDTKKNVTRAYSKQVNGSKFSELSYEIIAEKDGYFLLAIYPVTGRTHQIRVQLSAMGCPIVGDNKYTPRTANALSSVKHLCLHAARLNFTLPGAAKRYKVEAVMGSNMAATLSRLSKAE